VESALTSTAGVAGAATQEARKNNTIKTRVNLKDCISFSLSEPFYPPYLGKPDSLSPNVEFPRD
jgi:hypothetical protein